MDLNLAELRRRHKALDRDIADAIKYYSTDDLIIRELKRRKLYLKDEIERVGLMSNYDGH